MANSYLEIPVTGVDSYAFPFPYLEQSHIKVYAGGVLQTQGVHYTFTDSNTIEFSVGNVPSDTNTSILIQRVTDDSGRLVTYSNTGLDADDLNLGSNQNFYLAQEAVDAAALNITKGVDGVTSVDGRLTNVEDPIDAQDAATKAYVASQLTQSATGGVYIQATEPTSASLGDLWVDPDNNIMSVYTSTGWANGGTVESTSYNFTGSDLLVFGSYYIIPNVAVGVANIDQVFINGVLLKETTVALDFTTGDWDRSSSFIAFENALASDDEITITTTARMSNLLADAVVTLNANLDTVLALASSGSVNGITLKEQFTATAGQQVFNLTNNYVQAQNNISVYVNGVLQSAYGETSTSSVTLVNPASLGDEVVFIINEHSVSNTVTDSDNVTYTPAGTGAVVTTVQEKLRETVSVKDFGAVGDGVTDDTAAIQAAIDIGSKQVNFPEGTYSISSNRLFITSPVSLVGFNSAELIAADGLTYGSASTVGNGFIDVLDSVGVTFSGLTFTTLETSTISACVHFRGCSDVKVTGCTFNTPSNPNGSKCIIVQRSPNTPNYQVRNILVSGNIFNQSSNACLIIGDAATHPTNILIDGNIINGRDTVVYGSSIKVDKYTNNCVISNNTINGNGYGSEGITIEQGSHNCLVTGNTIHDCTDFGVKLTTDSADFAAAFDTITVSNNTIYSITSGSGYGIYMDSTGAVSDNITIKGNVITDVKSGIREAINNQTNLVITGNHINNPTTVGLSIQSNNTIVEGNIVKGGSSILSLSTSNSPTGLVVMNNIFEVDNGDSAISYSYGAAHSSDYVLRGNSGLRANSERANGTFTLAPDIAASEVYTSGGAVTSTLPDGSYAGQIKVIHGSISGSWNSSTVSVSNHETSSPEVFTLPVRTASVTLMWDTHKWVTLSSSGVTL